MPLACLSARKPLIIFYGLVPQRCDVVPTQHSWTPLIASMAGVQGSAPQDLNAWAGWSSVQDVQAGALHLQSISWMATLMRHVNAMDA